MRIRVYDQNYYKGGRLVNMNITSCQSSFSFLFRFMLYFITGVVDAVRVNCERSLKWCVCVCGGGGGGKTIYKEGD